MMYIKIVIAPLFVRNVQVRSGQPAPAAPARLNLAAGAEARLPYPWAAPTLPAVAGTGATAAAAGVLLLRMGDPVGENESGAEAVEDVTRFVTLEPGYVVLGAGLAPGAYRLYLLESNSVSRRLFLWDSISGLVGEGQSRGENMFHSPCFLRFLGLAMSCV